MDNDDAQMSQVVSCSRCGMQSEVRCDLCPSMTPLCRPCATPHYRLYHDMDFNTRTPLPPSEHLPTVGLPSVTINGQPVKILDGEVTLKKKGRKKSPQRLVSDYIKKMKQP